MKDHSSSCGWLFPHKIGGGCLALTSVCLTAILMLLAVSWSLILFSPFSTPAMMSRLGVFFGGTAKVQPFSEDCSFVVC